MILAACAVHIASSVVSAQACIGQPAAGGALRVGGGVSLADSSRAVVGSVGALGASGLFGSVGGGRVSYDYASGATTFGFLEGGKRITPTAWRPQVCVVAGASHGVGPRGFAGTGTDVAISSVSYGIASGLVLGSLRGIVLNPNLSVTGQLSQTKVTAADLSQSNSASGGVVSAALSIIVRGRVSLQPAWQLPFASDGDEPTMSLTASIALGRGRSPE